MAQRDRKRGTALLMVIGLLTVIAMLGSMLLLVARLDRQTNQALATAAPENTVAQGVLDRLLADRRNDLYMSSSNVLYGDLATDPTIAEREMIDYPADPSGYDQALACIEPTGGTVWRHVSHLPGTSLYRDPKKPNDPSASENVPTTDPSAVDTDGDGTADALLFPTGILDRDGGTLWAAVRMIDASGLLNVNIAGTRSNAGGNPAHPRAADPSYPMDPSYVALENLLQTGAQQIVTERDPPTGNGPYDMGDMLALADPCATCGRLFQNAGGTVEFANARGSMTAFSTSGTLSPLWAYLVPGEGTMKRNPNDLADPSLDANVVRRDVYIAFRDLLNGNDSNDPSAPTRAAQLTVNLIDYMDADSNPTRIDAHDLDATNFPAGSYFFGVERHPFVSKVFRRRVYLDPSTERESAAIELINPYVERIDLTKYSVTVNGTTPFKTNQGIDPSVGSNPGRFVIYSDTSIQIDPNVPDPSSRLQLSGLNTGASVKIMWKDPSDTWQVCVDETPPVDCSAPSAMDPCYWSAKFRDDRVGFARYSLDTYADPSGQLDPNADYTNTDPSGPKMGQVNPYRPPDSADRAPVYVRNGPLISLGDMMRVLAVGPNGTTSLSARLAAEPATGRWLDPSVVAMPQLPAIAKPAVPAGCVLSEFFNLVPADPSGHVAGLVNINTAPSSVLQCLPGIAAPDYRGRAAGHGRRNHRLPRSPAGQNHKLWRPVSHCVHHGHHAPANAARIFLRRRGGYPVAPGDGGKAHFDRLRSRPPAELRQRGYSRPKRRWATKHRRRQQRGRTRRSRQEVCALHLAR